MNLGHTIKELRKKKGYTQKEFGVQVNLTQGSVSQIEKGNKNPTDNTLNRICEVLDVPKGILYIMSFDESDVKKGKKADYNRFKPILKEIIEQVFI